MKASIFRTAAHAHPLAHLRHTLIQVLFFWGFFLLVLPQILLSIGAYLKLPSLHPRPGVGLALLLLFSALGLWSAWSMSTKGDGTPFPTACANRLVISGPYAWIRNPMATAGIAQGISISILWGSPLLLGYALLGGLVWHTLVRPLEERDLDARFGESFRKYRRAVRCWIPRHRPYPSTDS